MGPRVPVGLGAALDLALVVPGDVDGRPADASFLLVDLCAVAFGEFLCAFLGGEGGTSRRASLTTRSAFSMLSSRSCVARIWLVR
jgi:hypothetical protein